MENPGLTMTDIPLILTNARIREKALANVRNDQVRLFWDNYARLGRPDRQLEHADSTLNKLDEFLSQPIVRNIVGQSRTTADFRKFMDEGMIVLVPLSVGRLGGPVVTLVGSLLVLQILNAALSRISVKESERRPFYLYADEYQRFATPTFADLLTEARKFGLGTTLAHQTRAQLDLKSRSASLNASNILVFSVSGDDAEELAKEFDRTPPPPEVVGQEPVMAISQESVEQLLRGQADPRIARAARDAFSDLVRHSRELSDDDGLNLAIPPHMEGLEVPWEGYRVSRDVIRAGIRRFNSYFASLMEGTIRLGSVEQRNAISDALVTLRAFYRIAPYETKEYWRALEGHTLQDLPHLRVPPFPSYMRGVIEMPFDSTSALKELIAGEISGAETGLDTYMESRRQYWSTMPYRYQAKLHGEARKKPIEDRSRWEAENARKIIKLLVSISRHLSEEPLLVNSGTWKPRFGPQRSYTDMEADIANRLVAQPQFSAWFRGSIDGAPFEVRLRTPRWLELQDEAHGFSEPNDIVIRSRALYARPRMDVEKEIANRHDSDEPPPSTSRVVPI
jgi:hypothetical protein